MAKVRKRSSRVPKRGARVFKRSKRVVGRASRAVRSVTRIRPRSSEWKYFDIARPGADPSNPGANLGPVNPAVPGAFLFEVIPLNDMTAGSAVTQRDGRQIVVRKCVGHVEVQAADVTTGVEYCDFRVAIVLDRQSNGSQAFLASDLWNMKKADGTSDPSAAVQSTLRNMDNINRFAILWERRFDMAAAPPMVPANGQPNGAKANYHRSLSWYLHNLNFTTQFASASRGNITTNALYFVVYSQTSAHVGSATSGRIMGVNCRTTFTDK